MRANKSNKEKAILEVETEVKTSRGSSEHETAAEQEETTSKPGYWGKLITDKAGEQVGWKVSWQAGQENMLRPSSGQEVAGNVVVGKAADAMQSTKEMKKLLTATKIINYNKLQMVMRQLEKDLWGN